jgi:hypothetical protein
MTEALTFNKNKNNIYIKEKDNTSLIIIPDCYFVASGIFKVDNTKKKILTFYINGENDQHKEFIGNIRNIYDQCSIYIEKDEDINPDIISNPIYKKNDSSYILSVNITDWNGNLITKFFNVDDDQIINEDNLENKTFSLYPAICIEKMYLSTKNNVAYIEFILKEAYIKINQNKRLLNYENAKNAIGN